MSAYVVSEAHIRFLVNAGLSRQISRHGLAWRAPDGPTHALGDGGLTPAEVGAMLWAENYASVNYRYCEKDVAPEYVHKSDPYRKWDAVAVLKAIACYEYQACEHPGWKTSEARAFCEELRGNAIHALPGYAEASWEVSASE